MSLQLVEDERVTIPPGLNLGDCYQCGKCTAGCPVASRMDRTPNQIVRLLQLGRIEKAVSSAAIWECVSCQTCTTRCPKSVGCAGAMDFLRQLSVERTASAPSAQRTIIFQKAFLQNIRCNGRLDELELVRTFKTSAFMKDLDIPFLFKDASLAPRMQQRGKLKLHGEKARDRGVLDRIFERCLEAKI
jgi:heterodisulfide reductase subunit C2